MLSSMAIRCITFDWGDTLAANYGMPYLATQRSAFGRLAIDLHNAGCEVPADFMQQCMKALAVQWKSSIDPLQNPEHREFDFQAMISSWVATTVGPAAEHVAVQGAVERCKDRLCDTVLPFTESAPTLAALKAKGLRLGILSHVPWPGDACRRWFARHGLAEHLDFYSLSSEIGWIKPNPLHFTDALRQSGVLAHEILHVGDHPMRDVEGARRAGFRTCLRWTECLYPEESLHQAAADVTILQLHELTTVVDQL